MTLRYKKPGSVTDWEEFAMKRSICSVLALVLSFALLLTLPVSAAGSYPPDGFTFTVPDDEGHYVVDGDGNLTPYGNKPKTPKAPASDSVQTQPAAPVGEIDTSEFAAEVLRMVNAEREKEGLSALSTDTILTQMAQQRAGELVESYSHVRPNGERSKSICDEYETSLIFAGENAALNATPAEVMEAWMNSQGHRNNILRENAEYLGIGFVQKPNSTRFYWVQLFAR